jgi:cohesin complex subunit SA-1/2
MTRLRAAKRGGVAAKQPIYIDYEEEDDLFFSRKRKPTRKPVEREKHHVEKPHHERVEKERFVADKDRESNIDENSLYYIVRHSKSAIAVNIERPYL